MTTRKSVTSSTVAAYLREGIQSGRLGPEDKLPSERELSELLQTSRVTAREALKQLEAAGEIYRSNRRGWFVTPERIRYDPSRAAFFMDYVQEQGQHPFSQQLSKTQIVADATLAKLMGVAEGEPLVLLQRLRGANNRPVYVEKIYLRETRLPGIYEHDLERSVSRVMQQTYHAQFDRIDLDITVGSLDSESATHLQAPAGYSCINILRRTFDPDGEVLELDLECWRHDALQLVVSLFPASGQTA